MKQKLFSLILLLIAGTLSPTLLMAETLKVGDKTITGSQSGIRPTGFSGSEGTISWNASTKTLTFNNVVMSTGSNSCVYYTGEYIQLRFEGKNVLKSNCDCFCINTTENCTIISNSDFAYLELESQGTDSNYSNNCINFAGGTGMLDISNIYLKATSKGSAAISGNSSNYISIQTSWVQAESNAFGPKKKAIAYFVDAYVGSGSYVDMGTYDKSVKSFVYNSTNMAKVDILPKLTVGGTIVDTDYDRDEDGYSFSPKGMEGGTIYFDGENYINGVNSPLLTFNAVKGQMGNTKLPSPYGTTLVYNKNVENLIFEVANANTLSPVSGASESWGIYSAKPLFVKGYNSSTASLSYTGDYGLYCDDDLTIANLKLDMQGEYPIDCKGMNMVIRNSTITATTTATYDNADAIRGYCTLTGCDVSGGYNFGSEFFGADGKVLKTVKIVPTKSTYPFTIAGRTLNDVNIANFAAKGWKSGTLSYDATNRKLTLTKVDIDVSTDNPDVAGIRLLGDNNNANYVLYFGGSGNTIIAGNKPALEIGAYGSVTISTGNVNGYGVTFTSYGDAGCKTVSDVERDITLNGANISFMGSGGGLVGGDKTTLKLVKGNYSYYSFLSIDKDKNITSNPAFTVGKFVNDDGFESQYAPYISAKNLYYSPFYWDAEQKKPMKNGGAVANLVNLRPYTEQYNVWIGDIRLNDINSKGLAANFFTKAGDTQVTYDASKKTLTLNNADIDLKAKSVPADAITVYDDETVISLNGVNKVKPAGGNSGIFAGGATTITSATKDFKSTLELVSGLKGMGIDMHYSSGSSDRFVIQDRAVVTLTGPWTPGIGDKTYEGWGRLMVADATIHVSGGITGMAALSMSDCGFSYPVGADFDKEKGMVVNFLGEKASPVEIFSINDNVTEMIGAIAIDEENFPDAKFRTYLLEQDYGKDGRLSLTEVGNVTMIDVPGLGIENLKGIEHFTALAGLDCSDNKLTTLDLSKNTNLVALDCSINQLTTLDLSKNTNLVGLICYLNKINGEQMDALIASLPTLSGGNEGKFNAVSDGEAEQNICTGPQATDAKQKGWTLTCWYISSLLDNPFEGGVTINAFTFPDVKFRGCVRDFDTDADGMLSDNEIKAVKKMDVHGKEIADMTGIGYFTELTSLWCYHNSLTSLDVSKNVKLKELNCCLHENLTSLDVSNNTDLETLDCVDCGLTTLDLSNNKKLKSLSICGNKIKGVGMDQLVEKLPVITEGYIFAIRVTGAGENNVLTGEQVKIGQDKGWNFRKLTKYSWVAYFQGDVNNDYEVNQKDLDMLVGIIMGKITNYKRGLANVNGDGSVDVEDIVFLVNILNGK